MSGRLHASLGHFTGSVKLATMRPEEVPGWTPLGRSVARRWPIIALAVGLVVGLIAGLVIGSLVTGAVVTAVFTGILLLSFYVPPRRGWPSGSDKP